MQELIPLSMFEADFVLTWVAYCDYDAIIEWNEG